MGCSAPISRRVKLSLFQVPKKLFRQIVTIHGSVGDDFVMPLVWAFLPNKEKASYKKLFEQIKKMMVIFLLSNEILKNLEQLFHFSQIWILSLKILKSNGE